jgi:hypothetical protein
VTQAQHPAPGYFLRADESERAWLLAQGEVHRAATEALLAQHAGQPNQMLLLRFIDIFRDQIVDDCTIDATALGRLTDQLTEHLSKPETFTVQPLLFQVWGRKPG